jgi:KaiC/GvpD/RAD55 family RecA-like ATPase
MALQLLKLLLNYNYYNKYNNYISKFFNKDNIELYTLYNFLVSLHNKYEKDITLEEYTLYVLTNCTEKYKESLAVLLESLSNVDESSVVVEDIIKDLEYRQKAYDVALAALEVSEGRKDFNDLLVLAKDLNVSESDSIASESMFVTNDLEELYNEQIHKQGLRWRLGTLNRMLGSLRPGDFGFIFARPETGKTTFLASEISHFAKQVDKPILWFNNEEQGSKVQLRLYQAMLGCTLTELFSDIHGNKQRYLELGGSNIKIFDSASIHRKQVEQLVRELEPSLIIFDQIDKIKGFTDDREDLRLGAIYIWARELAKEYCPAIAVCQADASGEGKRWLTMENVANAKTAKQAEADWILGIGKTHAVTEEYQRHLSLCKNKLSGDADTDPNLRHGRETVNIKPEIARYEDM